MYASVIESTPQRLSQPSWYPLEQNITVQEVSMPWYWPYWL